MESTLKLDFILHNQGFAFIVDLLWEFGRDGMVGSSVLDNETLITLHPLEDDWLLDGPFSNICPLLILLLSTFGVLLGVGRLPSGLPITGKLLYKVTLDGRWLL